MIVRSKLLQNSQASFDLGTCGGLNIKLSQQVNSLIGQKAKLEEDLAVAQGQISTLNKRISYVCYNVTTTIISNSWYRWLRNTRMQWIS